MPGIDAAELKQLCRGQARQILNAVAGIPAELLDGKHHPCPYPGCPDGGGKDRFRLVDAEDGACLCNQCQPDKCGDYYAAIMKMHSCDLPTAIGMVAKWKGYTGSNGHHANGNGKANGKASSSKPKPPKGVFPTLEGAVAWKSTRPDIDCKPTGQWSYTDPKGNVIVHVVRFDPPGKTKTFSQLSPCDGGWQFKGAEGVLLPLYHESLAQAKVIQIHEGERKTDDARQLGFVATTNCGGSGNASATDWSALNGKEVAIFLDGDEPSQKWEGVLKMKLADLMQPPSVKIIRLPGLEEGEDLSDYVRGRRGEGLSDVQIAEEVNDAIKRAEPVDLKAAAAEVVGDGKPAIEYKIFTAGELHRMEIKIEYHIDNLLVARQPCVWAAAAKTMKTMLLVDGAFALSTGGKFLNTFQVNKPVRTLVMTGESGLGVIQEQYRNVCKVADVDPDGIENLMFSEDLPKLADIAHLDAIRKMLTDRGIDVLCVDPFYLTCSGVNAENMMAQGQLLGGLGDVCREAGATMVMVHHTKKNLQAPYDIPELNDLAWAGFVEYFRQWVLMARRQKFEPGSGAHKLWLTAGGSAGHSCLWGVNIAEGSRSDPGGRRWEVEVVTADEARQAAASVSEKNRSQKKEVQDAAATREAVDRIERALNNMPDHAETVPAIADAAGYAQNAKAFKRAISKMITEGELKPFKVAKAGRKFDGYQRIYKGNQA